jgi:hypothetical protein
MPQPTDGSKLRHEGAFGQTLRNFRMYGMICTYFTSINSNGIRIWIPSLARKLRTVRTIG